MNQHSSLLRIHFFDGAKSAKLSEALLSFHEAYAQQSGDMLLLHEPLDAVADRYWQAKLVSFDQDFSATKAHNDGGDADASKGTPPSQEGKHDASKDATHDAKILAFAVEVLSDAYYAKGENLIADFEYDIIYEAFELLVSHHPFLASFKEISLRVGAKAEKAMGKFAHQMPMLSMGNIEDKKGLEAFLIRIQKTLDESMNETPKSIGYTCEPKYDGIAVSIVYIKRKLNRAVTRGDGKTGEIITQTITLCHDLPHNLPNDAPDYLEVRGEAYMLDASLEVLNSCLNQGEKPYANTRNATSGVLRRLQAVPAWQGLVHFSAYDVMQSPQGAPLCARHSDALLKLHSWGVPSASPVCVEDLDGIQHQFELFSQKRPNLGYEVDGMVVKVDDHALRNALGTLARAPRWAVAYKFPPKEAHTKLLGVRFQVGRSGVLSPVADLEPVALDGVVIAHATLHNREYIQTMMHANAKLGESEHADAPKGLCVGDTVSLVRAAGVIPRIVHVVVAPHDRQEIALPVYCVSCGSELFYDEKFILCQNFECPGRLVERLIYFCSRACLNIESLGEKLLKQFFALGVVKTPADLYDLDKEILNALIQRTEHRLEGVAQKSIAQILLSLERSKSQSFDRVLCALGIPGVGVREAQNLARRFGSMDALMQQDEASISLSKSTQPLDQVGQIRAQKIVAFFKDARNQREIERLRRHGLAFVQDAQAHESGIFAYKRVVITGSLSRPRNELESMVVSQGGKVYSGVSAKIDVLVVGKNPGSKLEKAMAINEKKPGAIEIIDEETLHQKIKESKQ